MTAEEFIALVERYGVECAAGGQGYTVTEELELLDQIRVAVAEQWRAEQ
ncbi:hypothetical protein [Phytohabitans rumicis]|uniref:Uncharacterized protein n=1 Tax=Phytohabitans rumicis TaxID=1076125 RepID=A0A6V8L7N9_9ACTN|nr:hypothetical protein [Phytohabitans rumicis]GFJ91560.1 hypothetical protein Prum_052020 [Phytohabitans rumicis]